MRTPSALELLHLPDPPPSAAAAPAAGSQSASSALDFSAHSPPPPPSASALLTLASPPRSVEKAPWSMPDAYSCSAGVGGAPMLPPSPPHASDAAMPPHSASGAEGSRAPAGAATFSSPEAGSPAAPPASYPLFNKKKKNRAAQAERVRRELSLVDAGGADSAAVECS
eukprot:6496054-Prymnesium_polylepis.1